MSHFHLPAEAWNSNSHLVLTDEEARHCRQVRRHRLGDIISILDGKGRQARGTIQVLDRDRVEVKIDEVVTTPPPRHRISLLQAIPKGDSMEWIIEKSVELGVAEIFPLTTERTISRFSGKDADKKQAKWQKQIIEACKQCGQTWQPFLHPVCGIESALKATEPLELRLVASLESGAMPMHLIAMQAVTSAAIAIGPEGDFSSDEYEMFRRSGWQPLTLGHLTLRCETAAVASVAILAQHLVTLT